MGIMDISIRYGPECLPLEQGARTRHQRAAAMPPPTEAREDCSGLVGEACARQLDGGVDGRRLTCPIVVVSADPDSLRALSAAVNKPMVCGGSREGTGNYRLRQHAQVSCCHDKPNSANAFAFRHPPPLLPLRRRARGSFKLQVRSSRGPAPRARQPPARHGHGAEARRRPPAAWPAADARRRARGARAGRQGARLAGPPCTERPRPTTRPWGHQPPGRSAVGSGHSGLAEGERAIYNIHVSRIILMAMQRAVLEP